MRISLITDELSADPETAIELASSWGIHDFELRGFDTDRVPRLSDYQRQRLRDMLSDYQARIVAVGPGLFKFASPPLQAPRAALGWMDRAWYESWSEAQRVAKYHLDELLPASLDYANELGARLVIIFGFDRAGAPPGPAPDEVLNCLRLAAERAAAAGLVLAIENEDGFWADTGERSARLLESINHPALGINWDPGNAFFADDEPFPAGYAAVRKWVRHIHFKDALRDAQGILHYVANGQVDWEGQVRALVADSYEGHISIETHIRPKVASARASFERLRSLLSAAMEFSPSLDG